MKEGLETIKAGIDNVKAAGITGILLFVVFFPEQFGSWMDKAGIEKLGFAGGEVQRKLKNTDAAVQNLDNVNKLTEAQLKSSKVQIKSQLTFIETLKTRMDASEQEQASQLVAAGKALIAENEKGINEANDATLSAQKVIIANSQLIQTNSQWIILVGSDTTLESAEVEVTKAREKKFNNVKLFKKRGVFRTALVYPNRQEAADALADAKVGTRSDAYMVSLEKWCPNQSDATSGVVDCSE